MATQIPIIIYSDVNPDVVQASQYELVYNADSIQKSILTILGTRKGTRVFNRQFGSYLLDLLYDPMDDFSVERIKTEIISAIEQWEPRVVLLYANILPDYDNQMYYVSMEYQIPTLGNQSVSLSFNLQANKG